MKLIHHNLSWAIKLWRNKNMDWWVYGFSLPWPLRRFAIVLLMQKPKPKERHDADR